MSADYGGEQDALDCEIAELQASVERYEDGSGRVKRFIELVNRYTDFTELTIPMLNEFIEKIIVHEADKSSGEREQRVDIYLNFIGKFDVPVKELTAEELAEEEKQRRKRAQRRDAQRRYVERQKAKGEPAVSVVI